MPGSPVPRSANDTHRFVVGRDVEGRWIARDEQGLTGGVFADRTAAIRFAVMESNHEAGAVRFAPATAKLSLFN